MAESRKRAVSLGRTSVLDEADDPDSDNYALRLTQALEAISAAQVQGVETVPAAAGSEPTELVTYTRRGRGFGAAVPAQPVAEPAAEAPEKPARKTPVRRTTKETATRTRKIVEQVEPEAPIVAPELPAHDAQQPVVDSPAPSLEHTPAVETDDQADEDWLADAMDNNERIAALLNQAASAQREAAAGSDTAAAASVQPRGLKAFLAVLDRLPPIRLPIGPPIPWKLGLPALIALVVLMGLTSRFAGTTDNQGVTLPAQQTYPVQQEAPLFTQTPQAQATAAPVGVAEPAATSGFDVFDLAIKLAAVLGLAYGSLALLKKVGMGGSGAAKGSNGAAGLKVVSSLALAPNRTVHVISVPGGKTLLVGVTPNQVNLIAELGEVELAQAASDGASFLDVLSSKLSK